ncbi:hypothetical protein QZM52_01965 [Burkholderia metallica]|uniref:Transposase n=1 Tax=Burkholderia metallica TaxID=488729 RepID=A0ABT8P532_9BURK|nr:hypothetical protein [Burkholderia metallica]MDN7930051.1 hypothetical protein [Burkholderia metallica]
MTLPLCQRRRGADRTIRLFSGFGGQPCEIDANPLDRRGRTRISCRRAAPIRQLLLWECHYDEVTVSLPLADEPHRPGACPGFREACRPGRPHQPDRAAHRAASAGQLAAIVRFGRRRTMYERLFALIQFR